VQLVGLPSRWRGRPSSPVKRQVLLSRIDPAQEDSRVRDLEKFEYAPQTAGLLRRRTPYVEETAVATSTFFKGKNSVNTALSL
jgi:hypothetical protein